MVKVVNYVESKGWNFFTAPIGSHPAIIVWIAELWTAMSEFGKDDREQDLIRVFFEIEANVNIAKDWEDDKFEDKIFLTEQNYTCTITNKSNLWKMIAWVFWQQPKEIKNFSLDMLLWKKCVINVTHNDWWYSKIESTSLESKKMNYHNQVKETFYFWLNEWEYSADLLNEFAPFVQDRIFKSKEYKKLFGIETFEEQEENIKKEAKEQVTTKDAEEVFVEAKKSNEFE